MKFWDKMTKKQSEEDAAPEMTALEKRLAEKAAQEEAAASPLSPERAEGSGTRKRRGAPRTYAERRHSQSPYDTGSTRPSCVRTLGGPCPRSPPRRYPDVAPARHRAGTRWGDRHPCSDDGRHRRRYRDVELCGDGQPTAWRVTSGERDRSPIGRDGTTHSSQRSFVAARTRHRQERRIRFPNLGPAPIRCRVFC